MDEWYVMYGVSVYAVMYVCVTGTSVDNTKTKPHFAG